MVGSLQEKRKGEHDMIKAVAIFVAWMFLMLMMTGCVSGGIKPTGDMIPIDVNGYGVFVDSSLVAEK